MRLACNNQRQGLTIPELIIVLGCLLILAGLLLPGSKRSDQRINCVNNLKQVGLSFRTWALDNGDQNPMRVGIGAGGCSDYLASGGTARNVNPSQVTSRGVFDVFMVMSNELSTPKIILCPSEYE